MCYPRGLTFKQLVLCVAVRAVLCGQKSDPFTPLLGVSPKIKFPNCRVLCDLATSLVSPILTTFMGSISILAVCTQTLLPQRPLHILFVCLVIYTVVSGEYSVEKENYTSRLT